MAPAVPKIRHWWHQAELDIEELHKTVVYFSTRCRPSTYKQVSDSIHPTFWCLESSDDSCTYIYSFVTWQRYFAPFDCHTRDIRRARHTDMQAKTTVDWYAINVIADARFWRRILAKRGISLNLNCDWYINSKQNDIRCIYFAAQVFNDAAKFIKLCEQLDVVPDIWSLYEWSVWLTPTWKRTKRFETVFYLVGVDEQPTINVENDEVQNSWVISSSKIQFLFKPFSITIWNFFFSGVHPTNCSNWIDRGRFGFRLRNCMRYLVWATNQILINCCHLQKRVARIHQRHWSFPFTFTHRMVWYIAIRATISIQRIQTTIRRYTIWNNMQTKRVPSVGRWPRICIVPNWNRLTMSTFIKILAISTIIWVQIQPHKPTAWLRNYNFAKN